MPLSRNSWPGCTVDGCDHALTHRDGNALAEAVREHPEWVATRTGKARCVCHGPRLLPLGPTPFPCDESAAR